MAHIAMEGHCFVLSACQYTEEKDYPPDHAVADATHRNPENVMIAGGSAIMSPLGNALAGLLYDQEGVLTAVQRERGLEAQHSKVRCRQCPLGIFLIASQAIMSRARPNP